MYADTLLDIAMMHADTLIVNAQKGDEQALNKLVSLWYKRIYNYALKYFCDHDQATEASQRTFIAMYRNISKLQEADKFRSWLYRIATNCCHEEERKSSRSKVVSFTVSGKSDNETKRVQETEAQGARFDPEQSYQQKELSGMLMGALGELNEEQRAVVIMKEYEGLKFREISEIIKVSENTVKTRLYAGLKHLKDILKKKNITKDTVYYEL